MDARTPHPLDAWEMEHGDAALAEGWGLFEVSDPGHDAIEIERDDDSDIFADDYEAGAHVIASAWLGNPTAKAAVDLLFEQKCYQALAEAAAAFVQVGYDMMTDPADIPELLRASVANIQPRHLALMPPIVVNETSHVDPVTGITVYTNAEADRAYRLFDLNEAPACRWHVRLIFHATATQPSRFADVELTIRPFGNPPVSGLGSSTLTFRETNSDDEPIGPDRHVQLAAIDAIVVY